MTLRNRADVIRHHMEKARAKPFSHGEHDCAIFALTIASTLSGKVLIPPGSNYSTRSGAVSLARKRGHSSIRDAIIVHLDSSLKRRPIEYCMTGDICIGAGVKANDIAMAVMLRGVWIGLGRGGPGPCRISPVVAWEVS